MSQNNILEELNQYESTIRSYRFGLDVNSSSSDKLPPSPIISACIKTLLLLQEHHIPRSDLFFYCSQCIHLLKQKGVVSHLQGLSQDAELVYWNLVEQYFKSALDLNQVEVAEEVLDLLQQQFGNGVRVQKLEGLLLEAKDDFEEAISVYENVTVDSPQDAFVLKRKVAIYKKQRNLQKAIEACNFYIKWYRSDIQGFLELVDLYLEGLEYRKAIFCMEEALLLEPQNYLLHCKLAELFATVQDFEIAKKYYQKSWELNSTSNNRRSLFGLFHCFQQKDTLTAEEEATKKLVQDTLMEMYASTTHASLIKDFLLQK